MYIFLTVTSLYLLNLVHWQHFHEVAYSALMSDDLLDGIDEFLDDSIVLPPGDWDENLLLPVMHQRNEMRKRKRECGGGGRETQCHVQGEGGTKEEGRECGYETQVILLLLLLLPHQRARS